MTLQNRFLHYIKCKNKCTELIFGCFWHLTPQCDTDVLRTEQNARPCTTRGNHEKKKEAAFSVSQRLLYLPTFVLFTLKATGSAIRFDVSMVVCRVVSMDVSAVVIMDVCRV